MMTNHNSDDTDEAGASTSEPQAPLEGESTDTVDLAGDGPPTPLPMPTSLDEFVQHMDDACPIITADPIEAAEIGARYIIGQELGSGAIGQVIEAHDQHLSRSVAIKILHGGAGVSRERIGRFVAEAQITAQLEHPTVVPVYEIGRMPGGLPYFAMKRLRGETLDEIINNLRVGDAEYKDRYDIRNLVRMFYRLSQGIAYAHNKKVVHRDLKPANLMIGEYGDVQIMDWGLAKVMSDSNIMRPDTVQTVRGAPDLGTLDGAIAGTPAYMSPEQAHGDSENVGSASDIYSLGLILAEMVTLHRVFKNRSPEETLQQVRALDEPLDITKNYPDLKIEPELAAIIRKCTMPDPNERYVNAWKLSEDVRAYLEHRRIGVEPDLSHRKVLKWTRRNPMLAGAALTLGIVGVVHIIAVIVHQLFG